MVDGQRSRRESLSALRARLRPSDGDGGGWGDVSGDPMASQDDAADGWGAPTQDPSPFAGQDPSSSDVGAGGWDFEDTGFEGAGTQGSAVPSAAPPAIAPASAAAAWAAGGSVRHPGGEGISRATWFAIAAILIGGIGLGIGLDMLLAGIDIVGWMLEGAALYSRVGVAAVIVLAVIALAGLVLAIVALVRSRRRLWGTMALVAALILPPVSGAIGVSTGVTAFKENTISDVRLYASQLSPERVEGVYDAFEEHGITLPAEEEVLGILDEGQGAQGGGDADDGDDPSTSPSTTDDDHEEGEG